MSKNGIIVVLVVLIAVIVFAYARFSPNSPIDSQPTPTATVVSSTATGASNLVTKGETLFTQYRCNVCHTVDGQRAAGPTLKGLAGSQVTLNTGEIVTADTAYLQQSIIDPDAQIVAGYGPSVMSAAAEAFSSQIQQDENLNALVAYIQSLK